MKIHNNPRLIITPQQLLAHRSLQFINDLTRRRAHNQVVLILQIHI